VRDTPSVACIDDGDAEAAAVAALECGDAGDECVCSGIWRSKRWTQGQGRCAGERRAEEGAALVVNGHGGFFLASARKQLMIACMRSKASGLRSAHPAEVASKACWTKTRRHGAGCLSFPEWCQGLFFAIACRPEIVPGTV
jgi:hypothetical protein